MRFEPPVTEHLRDLRILLAVLTEDELTLVVVVLVLASSPVLASLAGQDSGFVAKMEDVVGCLPFLYSRVVETVSRGQVR